MLLQFGAVGTGDQVHVAIAVDVEHAQAIARILRNRFQTSAEVVTSDDPTASKRIAAFAAGDSPWLVAVRMVSEGVDIPRLRVGVYASTVTTELFFRQAVGRFVRWTAGLPNQKAYVYLPDDSRLRAHAFQIADARRHVLRKPSEDLDEEFRRDEADPAELDDQRDPEQLSLFSMLSAVATGMKVHGFTETGLAVLPQFGDDEFDVTEPAFDDFDLAGLSLELPDIPTEAGFAPAGGLSVAERKDDLRSRNAAVAQRLVDLTGWSHGRVHGEINRLAGVTSVATATTDQLERRLRHAESWLRRVRDGRGSRGPAR